MAGGRATKLNFAHSGRIQRAEGSARTRPGRTPKLNFAADRPAITPRRPKGPGKGWLDSGGLKPPTVRRAKPGKGWLDDSRRKPPTVRRAKPGKGWLDDGRRKPATVRRAKPGKGWLDSGRRRPPTVRRAKPGKGWLRPARPPRANWYSNGPTTGWIHRSRAKDRWRTRRRSLSGSLLSTVRDLLPTGERR